MSLIKTVNPENENISAKDSLEKLYFFQGYLHL